ncbi:MAG: NifU family protein [Chlorobi bacterium]|nr:NifU family protein [Chlorobiota bacterium]MCI0715045.1 NifU family protein [Chlorobiota bacterium]
MLIAEKTADIEDKINAVLDKIRPYLQIDGGDVMLVKADVYGIVELKLMGACNTCPLKPMTLRAGIERAIMHEVPEIKRIECFS